MASTSWTKETPSFRDGKTRPAFLAGPRSLLPSLPLRWMMSWTRPSNVSIPGAGRCESWTGGHVSESECRAHCNTAVAGESYACKFYKYVCWKCIEFLYFESICKCMIYMYIFYAYSVWSSTIPKRHPLQATDIRSPSLRLGL